MAFQDKCPVSILHMESSKKGHLQQVSIGGLMITLGIIYGDIGTSPLYVMDAVLREMGGTVTESLILGAVSCVFWTLTLQTTFKYIVLTLRADNNGEGGIFSLYALVRRYRKWLYIPAIIGGCTLLADGFITPPISVSSAIEGLKIIQPELNTVPIVLVILTIIFAFQRWGTALVGKTFGPLMFLWFLMLAALGVIQLIGNPHVLAALNPIYAYDILVNTPHGFWLLGAVFLCTTGAEALYSDLGHCGRKNIRITWGFVKLSLLLNYFGQAAYLLQFEGTSFTGKAFYGLMPDWFLPMGIGIATMAAIIASQALISGSFTLISEAVRLNFWPKVAIKYPTLQRGQLYVPSINIILWIGCLGVVLYFRESSNMEAAYGLAITLTMLMTTLLLTSWLITRKFPLYLVIGLLLVFLSLEITFLIANLSKFENGGYVTLIMASVLFGIMYVWYKARQIQRRYIHYNDIHKYISIFQDLHKDETLPKFASNLVFLSNANQVTMIEAKIVNSILKKKPKRADTYWIIHVNTSDEPHTLEYKVTHLIPGIMIRIDFNLGFREEQKINVYFRKVVDELVKNKEVSIISRHPSLSRHQYAGDFQFVIFERFLSYDNDLPLFEDYMLDMYFFMKKLSQPTVRAFGLDNSVVIVESVPLVISQPKNIRLKRKEQNPL